jgi:ParB family chromosome partitioning protein
VNDDLAATAADVVESALIANVHRVDLPPLDQAKAI